MSARPLTPSTALPSPLPLLSRWFGDVAQEMACWTDRRHSRHALSRLDAHILRDIGLTQDNVASETGKPFWRA